MSQSMFSSEVELGNFLGSIDIIPDAYRAILETSLTHKHHTSPSGFQVLAFNCSADYTTRFLKGEFDLVSSENLQVVDFISTKVNPSFSINKAAVGLFERLSVELKDIENKLILSKPLVVTGRSVGGYLAILFTLWLQHAIDEKEAAGSMNNKRPICITFGSPLVGDEALQHAISERPRRKSSFLNVVAKTDPVARLFSSNSPYKPFGTFLFCTETGRHTAFEDQESVLAVLDAMASLSAGNLQMHDYENDLISIERKVLYRGVSELGEFNLNPLRAGIGLQFGEVGVLDDISNDLIGRMEEKQAKMIKSKKNMYEPKKKLNEMKISLIYMEWYMKTRRSKGGNYDNYKKNAESREEIESHQLIVKHKRILNQYWKEIVEEKDRGAKLRKRLLYGGTKYRMIVEPLDIAEYYKTGKKDYIASRQNHYKLLEKWWIEDMTALYPSARTNEAVGLIKDSCFWAHVEEALILLRDLENGGSNRSAADIMQGLEEFEADVMRAINNRTLSPDIFLEGSSFTKWWSEYKGVLSRFI